MYGSVARHDERPLNAYHPSDVDLLVVFESDDELISVHRGPAISATLGQIYDRHRGAPRDLDVQLASRSLAEWDPTYAQHVTRDGIVLLARGPLPPALTPSDTTAP
ncbi:MAG: hypothetical protein ACHQ4H_00875 [Ktedonobacterales bacterium]